MRPAKIHMLETEDHGSYECHWLACRDPERFQESDGHKFKSTKDPAAVTCKRCLAAMRH